MSDPKPGQYLWYRPTRFSYAHRYYFPPRTQRATSLCGWWISHKPPATATEPSHDFCERCLQLSDPSAKAKT